MLINNIEEIKNAFGSYSGGVFFIQEFLRRGGWVRGGGEEFFCKKILSASPKNHPLLFVSESCDAGEFFTFEEFEGSTAAGGDVAHLSCFAALFDSGNRIAAADDGDTAIGFDFSDCGTDTESTFVEFLHFEAAHGAVPYNGFSVFDSVGIKFDSFGTDIEAHPAFGDVVADDLGVCSGSNLSAATLSTGRRNSTPSSSALAIISLA